MAQRIHCFMAVLAILSACLPLHAKSRNDELVAAACSGELEVVKKLLDQGLAVKGPLADQALMAAAEFGHMNVVEELVSRKILPRRNIQDELFLIAAFMGNQAVVSALLEGGMRLDSSVKNRYFPSGRLGGRSLLSAAHDRQEAMVQFLLDYKVDPNVTNDSGHYLGRAHRDRQGRMQPVSSSAYEEWIDDTPLIAAARIASSAVIKVLLTGGANVNVRNKAGATALMVAAGGGAFEGVRRKFEPVQLLVQAGASLVERDRRGRNALDFAKEKLEQEQKNYKEEESRLNSQKGSPSDEQKQSLNRIHGEVKQLEKIVELLTQVAAENPQKSGSSPLNELADRRFEIPSKVRCEQQIEAFTDAGCTQPAGMFKPPVQLELVEFLEKSGVYRVIFRQDKGKEIAVYCRKKDVENGCVPGEKEKKSSP